MSDSDQPPAPYTQPWRHPHIPRTWTAEQAHEVVDFLSAIIEDIHDIYWHELRELHRLRNPPPEFDDLAG
jgi:hypothetical protein